MRFTLGGILCTVFNGFVARYTVLHVHISTPSRQLHRVEAVDKTIVLCSYVAVLALHPLSQESSLAALALGSQNGTFAGHCKCGGSKLLSNVCVVGMLQQGQPSLG